MVLRTRRFFFFSESEVGLQSTYRSGNNGVEVEGEDEERVCVCVWEFAASTMFLYREMKLFYPNIKSTIYGCLSVPAVAGCRWRQKPNFTLTAVTILQFQFAPFCSLRNSTTTEKRFFRHN